MISFSKYLNETKALIEDPLGKSEAERGSARQAWKHMLKIDANECKEIIVIILHQSEEWKGSQKRLPSLRVRMSLIE